MTENKNWFITHDAVTSPCFTSLDDLVEQSKDMYSRRANDSLSYLEDMCCFDSPNSNCAIFGSGMGAIVAAIIGTVAHLPPKSVTVIMFTEGYRGSYKLFDNLNKNMGVEVKFIENPTQWALAKESVTTANVLTYIELPNVVLRNIVGEKEVASYCSEENTYVVVDATLATPLKWGERSAKYGPNYMEAHSLSKYASGMDNLFAGCVLCSQEREELFDQILAQREIFGSILNMNCYRTLEMGLLTLEARYEHQSEKASKLETSIIAKSPFVVEGTVRREGCVVMFRVKTKLALEHVFAGMGHLAVQFGGVHTIFDAMGFRLNEQERGRLNLDTLDARISVGMDCKMTDLEKIFAAELPGNGQFEQPECAQ